MFCKSCGAQNEDGAKFCGGCGKPLEDGTEQSVGIVSPQTKKNKAVPKKLIIGACVAVAALIAIICIVVNASSTIDLNKYLTIESKGYDGYGTAQASIDWDAIDEKYGDKMSYTKQAKEEAGDFLDMVTPTEIVEECILVQLEESSGLSNGDTIAYTWDIDEELFTYIRCKLKYKDGSFDVSDLKEVGKFDAFSDLEVTFSGIAPEGTATINYTGSDLSTYDFSCDKTYGLRNGDVVVVSITNSDASYYAKSLGMIPEAFEMEYTVSGLEEYIETYADLTDDFINELKAEAEDTIYSYTASSYNTNVSLSDLAYSGYIINSVKDGNQYVSTYNDFYIIYSGTVAHTKGDFSTTKVYFPVRFSNILKGNDGLTYSDKSGITGYSNFGNSWYSTKGYVNPLVCYMEIVEANRDAYKAECGDGFEAYAEYEAIGKLDDISDGYKEELYADAKDKIESYIASHYNGGSEVADLAVKGEYLLLAKAQGTDFGKNNKYVVVYAATVSNSNGKFDTTTVYFPVEYDGIVSLPGDEYMITTVQGILGNSTFANSWYSTKGYIDGTEMYSKIVTANRDNYTYEVSEELKEFGE